MTELPDWPLARGRVPEATAVMRSSNADFYVDEQLDIEFSGEGEHLWLHIEKDDLTTAFAAQQLSRVLGCPQRDIGFSGLKDRHALTRQWFSLRVGVHADPATVAEQAAAIEGLEVLAAQRHHRKLRRGTHRSNRFRLTLRDVSGDAAAIEADLARIDCHGLPNYFGEQRFAGGRNLELAQALFDGRRFGRRQRGIVLSAARSVMFNSVLAQRVAAGNWNILLPGDRAMLDGSGSHFAVSPEEAGSQELQDRLARFDIHPSGPLPGRGDSDATDTARAIEDDALAPYADWIAGLARMGVDQSRRALRLKPETMTWAWPDASTLVLEFGLPPGAYATTVLRECLVATSV